VIEVVFAAAGSGKTGAVLEEMPAEPARDTEGPETV